MDEIDEGRETRMNIVTASILVAGLTALVGGILLSAYMSDAIYFIVGYPMAFVLAVIGMAKMK